MIEILAKLKALLPKTDGQMWEKMGKAEVDKASEELAQAFRDPVQRQRLNDAMNKTMKIMSSGAPGGIKAGGIKPYTDPKSPSGLKI